MNLFAEVDECLASPSKATRQCHGGYVLVGPGEVYLLNQADGKVRSPVGAVQATDPIWKQRTALDVGLSEGLEKLSSPERSRT